MAEQPTGQTPKEPYLTFTPPVSGWCPTHGEQRQSLTVFIGATPGVYCLECYAAWVESNIPRLLLTDPTKVTP